MEDEIFVKENRVEIQDQSHPIETFAIFDGHGGQTAASHAKKYLHSFLISSLEQFNQKGLTDEGIWAALKNAIAPLSHFFNGNCGCTACIAVILNKKLWIVNTGDSRAILAGEEVLQLSQDANPNDYKFSKGIHRLGGTIEKNFGVHRINGELAVGRALGDHHITGKDGRECVIPDPKITCIPLSQVTAPSPKGEGF